MRLTSTLLALAGTAFLSISAFAGPVTFVTDGGSYVEAQKKALLGPAEKRLGIEIRAEGFVGGGYRQ